jgi:hypothetical protein
MAESKRKKEEE